MTAHERASLSNSPRATHYFPREHGATAMLLMPIFSVAILARSWHWSELAVLGASFAAISAKDPAVVVIRQKFVWKQMHRETPIALVWLVGWSIILISCALVLLAEWPPRAFFALGFSIVLFAALAILVNFKNRQRSTLFQIASAAALTSTSLATSLSATGSIPSWCWWFWALITLQASAGILVVHARLDARIALRGKIVGEHFRHAAEITLGVLACAAITAVALRHVWIALALIVAAAGYAYDLVRQRDSAALLLPLEAVGQRALMLSTLYSALLIIGLW